MVSEKNSCQLRWYLKILKMEPTKANFWENYVDFWEQQEKSWRMLEKKHAEKIKKLEEFKCCNI